MVSMESALSKPGPKPKASSKRNDPRWKAATVFMTTDTKQRLDRVIAMAKVLGMKPADQSEAVEAALAAYLAKRELKMKKQFQSKSIDDLLPSSPGA